MSDIAKSTEEIVEIVVNKKSWSEARDFVKQLIAEVPENKPKTRRKYEVILEKLGEIRTLINDKVAKIKSANEQIAERDSIIASLEAAAENEPIANTFGLVRHASYFTDTVARLEAGEEPIADEYHCYAPIQHVASRLKPIVAGSDGVIGIKAFASENFGHVIMFSDVVGLIEVRERTKLDPHNNPNDGAAVYVEAVTLAVEIADVYAKHFGAFDAIAATARHNTENWRSRPAQSSPKTSKSTSNPRKATRTAKARAKATRTASTTRTRTRAKTAKPEASKAKRTRTPTIWTRKANSRPFVIE